MKTLLTFFSCLAVWTFTTALTGAGPQETEEDDGTLVMFWNLENFFDWRDSSGESSDHDFSSFGDRHWTKAKFLRKCLSAAKTILWISDEYGKIPDIIGVAEVENAFILDRLRKTDILKKHGFGYVHYESPDRRGIDVALLYRTALFDTLESLPFRISAEKDGKQLRTRDILMVKLKRKPDGDTLTLLVNHHPSKFGGSSTAWRREAAVERLRCITDSLHRSGDRNIIAMGDFNDTPDNPLYGKLTENGLLTILEPDYGEGTIRYDGRWEMIDLFFVSDGILALEPEMFIPDPPFLTVRDNAHSGDKPLRTYSGPRYIGGVSDHRPILLYMSTEKMKPR